MKTEEIWDHVDRSGDCWIWAGAKTPEGYGQASINGRVQYIHRVVMGSPKGLFVIHKCDNPSCVNPAHLSTGTAADNNRDCAQKGRKNRGSQRYCAKLTEDIVLGIRSRYAAGGVRLVDLAQEYGVSIATIHDAITGKRWGWLQG